MGLRKGDLIRWVVDWGIYTVSNDGEAHGHYPIYCHGIVMEVSTKDPMAAVVHCYDCEDKGLWTILHMIHDDFEILSGRAATFSDTPGIDESSAE